MVSTASPAELRLMLFDGAIRFAEKARAGLDEKNYEQLHNSITRCQDIVMELINSLRPEYDPDLCDKLTALYVFIYTRLMNAGSRRKIAPLDEALELLRYERDTWAMVLKKLAGENQSASEVKPKPSLPNASAIPNGTSQGPASNAALIGGRVSVKG